MVLCVSGFDPSGGAGMLADIKTVNSLGCYGTGVLTANTIQTPEEFFCCDWIPDHTVLKQLKVLLNCNKIKAIKIGIVQNLALLDKILDQIRITEPEIPVVWDPVISSSTDYRFTKDEMLQDPYLPEVLKKITMITPNIPEIRQFASSSSVSEGMKYVTRFTHCYLKGGHSETEKGTDVLHLKGGSTYKISGEERILPPKHGSGCVLSSALTCGLATGGDFLTASRLAKDFTERFLSSHPSLTGYHL
ncbi:hydroxymethylpyrimidine/phosphomethylpyrimidine kinase [Robertkochia solimangrovi]|nr:hydroxymethylpyrimidine/phosphomethylpyrimidine kinase [Robertkochia solimangrovi]